MVNLSKSEKVSAIKEFLKKTRLDAGVVGQTLGINESSVSPHVMLVASGKIIQVSKKEAEPDDRDNLRFSKFMGIEDYVKEHIDKDVGKLQWKAKQKIQHKKNLSWLSAGFFTPQVRSVVIGNALTQNIEGINPLEFYDASHRVTKLGPGGIPCHDRETEVFTYEGWKHWDSVTKDDLLGVCVNNRLSFEQPKNLYKQKYNGTMYGVKTKRIDYLVTPAHRMYCSHDNHNRQEKYTYKSEYKFETSEDIHLKKRNHLVAIDSCKDDTVSEEYITIGKHTFPMTLWAVFLGYWLADGYYRYAPACYEYRVYITKVKDKNPEEYEAIHQLLTKLELKFRYDEPHSQFVVNDKELALYMSQFGKSATKFVPAYILYGSNEIREIFFKAITLMDHANKSEFSFLYSSASKQMLEQVGWLAVTLGYAVSYFERQKPKENKQYQVLIQNKKEACVMLQKKKDQFYTVSYNDYVYCAEVTGGMLLTRRNGKTFWSGNSLDAVPDESRQVNVSAFGFLDPLHTAESDKIGVSNYFTNGVVKGKDNKLYRIMKDSETGKIVWVDHEKILNSVVHIPEH